MAKSVAKNKQEEKSDTFWSKLDTTKGRLTMIVAVIVAIQFLYPIVKDAILGADKITVLPEKFEKLNAQVDSLESRMNNGKKVIDAYYNDKNSLYQIDSRRVEYLKILSRICASQLDDFIANGIMMKVDYVGNKYFIRDGMIFPVIWDEGHGRYYFTDIDGISRWCE